MLATRPDSPRSALMMLDDAAQAARSGFACMFSTSDEYETALIKERRAQGRYARPKKPWPWMLLACGAVLMLGTALLLG